jgi:hypothetical protein
MVTKMNGETTSSNGRNTEQKGAVYLQNSVMKSNACMEILVRPTVEGEALD